MRLLPPSSLSFLLLLSLFGESLVPWAAGVLYALFSCAIVLMAIQCAQAARTRRINPVFIYAFFGGVVYFMHDIGFISGQVLQRVTVFEMPVLSVVSVVALFVLSIIFFFAQGGFGAALSPNRTQAEHIELIATAASPPQRARKSPGRFGDANDGDFVQDRIAKQTRLLKAHYLLTERESEIVELVARGGTVVSIAENLTLAKSTVQTHMRSIYAKLDIHKQRDLIVLLDSFVPSKVHTDNPESRGAID
jgi:DNA-binding CsgD family transcriptional regulator